ncbi:MAG: putative glycoside hydrolase [Myxococcota bacterium]
MRTTTMCVRWLQALVLFALTGTLARADVPPGASASALDSALASPAPRRRDPRVDPVSLQGQQATGVYLPAVYFRALSVEAAISLARRTGTDAFTIDLKDGAGRVTYPTGVEVLQDQVVPYMEDPAAIVRELKAAGMYTIARIVCFADPQLPARYPERAILHVRRDEPWVSWGTGGTWLDPFNRENHRMIVALAREAESFGFDEVQLDYVRFPVDEGTEFARYPAEDGTSRPDLLIELLDAVDVATRIPLGVDVFGLAAYRDGDPAGLGQDLEAWANHVEVFSPMLYINAMRTWQLEHPERSRVLVERGVRRLRERVGPQPVIRPFLQAFSKGAGPEGFDARFIARQVAGARNGGADGFLFWHPGARYGMFRHGMGRAHDLFPFPVPSAREEARR